MEIQPEVIQHICGTKQLDLVQTSNWSPSMAYSVMHWLDAGCTVNSFTLNLPSEIPCLPKEANVYLENCSKCSKHKTTNLERLGAVTAENKERSKCALYSVDMFIQPTRK